MPLNSEAILNQGAWYVNYIIPVESPVNLRMELDDGFIKNVQSLVPLLSATNLAREAFTILNWAIHERRRGRVIFSATPEGQDVERLAMPVLEQITPGPY